MDQEFAARFGKFFTGSDLNALMQKRHTLIGVVLIFIGLWALFSNFLLPLITNTLEMLGYDSWYIYSMFHRIPTLVVAVAVIGCGIHLVKGGKKQARIDEEFVEYGGKKDE